MKKTIETLTPWLPIVKNIFREKLKNRLNSHVDRYQPHPNTVKDFVFAITEKLSKVYPLEKCRLEFETEDPLIEKIYSLYTKLIHSDCIGEWDSILPKLFDCIDRDNTMRALCYLKDKVPDYVSLTAILSVSNQPHEISILFPILYKILAIGNDVVDQEKFSQCLQIMERNISEKPLQNYNTIYIFSNLFSGCVEQKQSFDKAEEVFSTLVLTEESADRIQNYVNCLNYLKNKNLINWYNLYQLACCAPYLQSLHRTMQNFQPTADPQKKLDMHYRILINRALEYKRLLITVFPSVLINIIDEYKQELTPMPLLTSFGVLGKAANSSKKRKLSVTGSSLRPLIQAEPQSYRDFYRITS